MVEGMECKKELEIARISKRQEEKQMEEERQLQEQAR